MSERLDRLLINYPFGNLTEGQKDALSYILYKLEQSEIQDLRQQSYTLATIRHETGDTYRPIKERGNPAYLQKKKYYPFIGRGFIQLTWEENYKKFSDILKIDLLANPELACKPDIAWRITELGMTKGLFTGKKLDDYFNVDETDWINARRIINVLDRAEEIAGIAKTIFKILIQIKDEDIPETKGLEEIK